MPTVPVLTVPGESLQGLPGGGLRPALSAPDQGSQADLQRGFNKIGDALGAIALKEQAKTNEAAILQGETELDNAYREFKSSQANRVGHAAAGITVGAEKWWTENVLRVSKGMNEPQRRVFMARADAKRGSILDTFSAFEATETRKARTQDREASDNTAIEDAAASPTEENVATQMAKVTANARGWAVDNGLDLNNPEHGAVYDAYLREKRSKLYSTALASLADNEKTAAQATAFYDAHAADMTVADRLQAHKIVETASVGIRAQTDVDEAIARFGDDGKAAADWLRAKYEPKDEAVEREGLARLAAHYQLNAAMENAKQRPLTEQALRIFNTNGGNWAAIPASIRNGMDQATLRRLIDGKDAVARYSRQTFDNLRGVAYSAPDVFLDTDVTDPALGLTPQHSADLQRLQQQIRGAQEKEAITRQGAFVSVAFNNAMAARGESNKNTVDTYSASFKQAYASAVESFKVQNKRYPSDTEAAQIAGGLLVYGVFERTGPDEGGFRFQRGAHPGQNFVAGKDAVKTRGETFLAFTGRPVNKANLDMYYAARAYARSQLQANNRPDNEAELVAFLDKVLEIGQLPDGRQITWSN